MKPLVGKLRVSRLSCFFWVHLVVLPPPVHFQSRLDRQSGRRGNLVVGVGEVGLAVALECPGSRIALHRDLRCLSGALDGRSSIVGRCSLPSWEFGPDAESLGVA